ncbi:MAG: DUF2190 family protein [Oscillibacter sp.]|jgi:hypothetical protein|nr:DUF2190 family protein [Oscillibacter sp.]
MKLSYEAIGQWCATFACSGVSEGQVVKISANDTAAACSDSDAFAGVAVSVAHGGEACSVQLGGMVSVPYSGTAPAVGWTTLTADENGGVKAASTGKTYLTVHTDTAAKTVTFVL